MINLGVFPVVKYSKNSQPTHFKLTRATFIVCMLRLFVHLIMLSKLNKVKKTWRNTKKYELFIVFHILVAMVTNVTFRKYIFSLKLNSTDCSAQLV